MVDWLSQYSFMHIEWKPPRSCNQVLIHKSLKVATVMDQYLASAKEREIVCHFLDFHETGDCPNVIK